MADSTVKHQDTQEEQQGDQERTDTKAEERDQGDNQTKSETKTESKPEPKPEPKQEPKEEPKEERKASREEQRTSDQKDNQSAYPVCASSYITRNDGTSSNLPTEISTGDIGSNFSLKGCEGPKQRSGKNIRHKADAIPTPSLSNQSFSNKKNMSHHIDITATANNSADNLSYFSADKSEAPQVSQVLTSLGIAACVNDISPETVTSDVELTGNAPVVTEEDSFFDGDERGLELEDNFLGMSDTMMASCQTINFSNPPVKTTLEGGFSKLSQGHAPVTDSQSSSSNVVLYRELASEIDHDVMSCSTFAMTSVHEELEAENHDGEDADEESRGELLPETPRTPEIEDDNRAEEKLGQSVKTMAHPGNASKEKHNNKFVFSNQGDRESQGASTKTNIPYSSLQSFMDDENSQPSDIRAGEVRRVTGWSQANVNSGEENILEPCGVSEPTPSPLPSSREISTVSNNSSTQEGIYSCNSFVSSVSTPDTSKNPSFAEHPVSSFVNQQNSISHLKNTNCKSSMKIEETSAIRPAAEYSKPVSDNNEGHDRSSKGQLNSGVSVVKHREGGDDRHQPLDFDFQQALVDFDHNVDVKAETFFNDKGSIDNDKNYKSADNSGNDMAPKRTPLILMGKRRELASSILGAEDGKAANVNNEKQNTTGCKDESVCTDNATADVIIPEEEHKHNLTRSCNSEDISRGREIIPKVYSYGRFGEGKRDERECNAVGQIVQNAVNTFHEKDVKLDQSDLEKSDAESCVDAFDNFDSRHLAMFQSRSGEDDQIDPKTSLSSSARDPQRKLSREQEDDKRLPSSADFAKPEVGTRFQGHTMMHATRSMSRSATDLSQKPSEDEAGTSGQNRRQRPRTTQTMATRGESDRDSTNKHVHFGEPANQTTKTSYSHEKNAPKGDVTKKGTKGSDDQNKGDDGHSRDGGAKSQGTKGENSKDDKKERNQNGRHSDQENDQKFTSRQSQDHSELSEGRTKQKEFFKLELQRLESSLKRESSKISAPSKKPHTPYIFNTLEPYYNTRITRFLVELPDEMKHGHTSRRTAQGLTDPWVDFKMDRDILPKVASKPVSRQVSILKREKEIRERKKRSAVSQSTGGRREGSTRLPKFPMVNMQTQDLANKDLCYSDVPELRKELKNKYSSSARTKIDEDYKRTQQDFFRMELDKLDEVHPVNRRHMRSAYFAYLQNTPGSKKAITDCVHTLESGKAK